MDLLIENDRMYYMDFGNLYVTDIDCTMAMRVVDEETVERVTKLIAEMKGVTA